MTDKLIEQIKRDREAGTPGPWVAGAHHSPGIDRMVEHHVVNSHVNGAENWIGVHIQPRFAVEAHGKANAARIARVPEMEARIMSDADEIARLRAELATAKECIANLEESEGRLDRELETANADQDALRAENEALRSGAVCAAVKPLVWEPAINNKPWHSAKAPWGWYYAQWDDETNAWFASLEMGEVEGPIILTVKDVDTVETAKAAAQADYERRIISALIIRPESEVRADLCIRRDDPALLAVVEALKWYESAACDCRKITREGDDARHALHADRGKRASTAIAAITERMGQK